MDVKCVRNFFYFWGRVTYIERNRTSGHFFVFRRPLEYNYIWIFVPLCINSHTHTSKFYLVSENFRFGQLEAASQKKKRLVFHFPTM